MWFDKDTGDFVGHTMALEDSDEYLSKPALPAMNAVKLYGESLARYGAATARAFLCITCTASPPGRYPLSSEP